MKLTKSKLKEIIKEELDTLMNEEGEEQMDCAELKKQLDLVDGEIRIRDPMDSGIPSLYGRIDDLEALIKKQGCP